MKTRIISSMIGLLLLVVCIYSGNLVFGIVMFDIAILALQELYISLQKEGYKPAKTVGYLSCIPLLIIALEPSLQIFERIKNISVLDSMMAWMFLTLMALLLYAVFGYNTYSIKDVSITGLSILYITFLFSFILLTNMLNNGIYYLWMIFISAWSTDSIAYFIGSKIGKTKLMPEISPKKTVEGAIGGALGCIIVMVVYGLLLGQYGILSNVPIYHYVIVGVLAGVLSQVGDLFASAIKRSMNIKDFGKILPGHGGILDRFDSVLLIAPVIYFYVKFLGLG